MKTEYKRDLYHNYMILSDCETKGVSYGWKMVIHNKIPYFLRVEERWIDNQKVYYYDISSKQPLQWVLQKGKMGCEQITDLFNNIFDGLDQAKEYLLSEDDIMLNQEYIYLDPDALQVHFCYYPGYGVSAQEQLTELIGYMMDKVDYKDESAVMIVYGLYQVSKSKECTLEELKNVLWKRREPLGALKRDVLGEISRSSLCQGRETIDKEEIKKNGRKSEGIESFTEEQQVEQEIKVYPLSVIVASIATVLVTSGIFYLTVRMGYLKDPVTGNLNLMKLGVFLLVVGAADVLLLNYLLSEDRKTIKVVAKKEIVETIMPSDDLLHMSHSHSNSLPVYFEDVGDQDIMEESESQDEAEFNTVLLGMDKESEFILYPEEGSEYEIINLTEFPFFIGKLQTKVDYVIHKNVISRFHARFSKEEEMFFLTDLNSTNGTYLNGCRLKPNEKIQVKDGDQISFADVRYYFRKV